MLNSGDCYENPSVLQLITRCFETDPAIEWLHGKCETIRGGRAVVVGKAFDPQKLYRGMRSVWHQTIFIKKHLHEKYGVYDVTLNIAMDYDLICRIAEEPFFFIEKTLVVFAPGGVSQQKYLDSLQQMREVYSRYFPVTWKLKLWQTRLTILYYLLQSPAGKWLYSIKSKLGLENF